MRSIRWLAVVIALVLPAWTQADVIRHHFTRNVVAHEPVDRLSSATNINPLFYFTELEGMDGATVVHRWLLNNRVMAEVRFQVTGPRWRVYSSKLMQPDWDGIWKLEVLDGDGNLLATDTISVLID
ncbi:DUF2914 domain-containing protein [Saccharospirillum mangrovi]|uniref:DUF2914 domain-containing protein n=1 Tax=Saccharospirillum mangrovi TaxID=2161747 RepID=UPI000D334713|nr:DUF2914 domain-containing protein [Saccharospirillum mangrovi]